MLFSIYTHLIINFQVNELPIYFQPFIDLRMSSREVNVKKSIYTSTGG